MPSHITFTDMRNKPRVYLALYHRDAQSLKEQDPARQFHSAIMIRPKASKIRNVPCTVFDATNFYKFAPDGKILNPNHEWWFRVRDNYDPLTDYRFLGAIMIGKLPEGKTLADVDVLLEELQLPRQNYRETGENCNSWARDAVGALMERKWAEKMDVEKLFKEALAMGQYVLAGITKSEELREGDRWRNFTTRED